MPSERPPDWRLRVPFRLGDVEVRPASNELLANGTIVRIKPRLMDVLLRLAAAPGEVVTRAALLTDAWPRRLVNDEVLSRAIADLRVAMGDDAREPRFIETLPKVGYRLLAPVRELDVAPLAPSARDAKLQASPAAKNAAPPASGAAGPAGDAPPRAKPVLLLAVLAVGALVAALVAYVMRPAAPRDLDAVASRLVQQLARAEPFSSGPDLEVSPRFSPDGQKVAYAEGRGTQARVVVRDVRGPGQITLGAADETSLSPVFFPDGARVAFYRANARGECGIVAQAIAGGAPTILLGCERQPRPRFDLSPDGSTLVYSAQARPGFPATLVLRTIATGEERTLTSPGPDAGDDLMPRFSPDGTRVAFFRGTQSHREAWIVDTQSARERSLRGPRGLVYGAAWLAAAGPLLVAADWSGNRALEVLDLDTGATRSVGARGARFPDVDRHGAVVFENAVYSANLFALDARDPARAPRELFPSTRYTNQAEFSPDGTRLAFVSNRDGAAGVYVADLDGAATRVAAADEHTYMRPHWSADGRAIYAVRVDRAAHGRRQQAVRIDLADRRIDVLAGLGDAVFDVRPAPNGDGLVVGEVADNAARLLRTDRAGDAPARLPVPIAAEYQIAGDRLAIVQPSLDGLTLCDLRTLACAPLALPVGERNRFDWLLTRDAVYYRPPGTSEVARHDLARGAVTWTHAFGPTAVGTSIAVSADGHTVVVAREAPLTVDLMLAPAPR